LVVDAANGIPVGLAVDAASVPETALGPAALALMPIPAATLAAAPVPVLADKAYDSDGLREHLADEGYVLVAPHRDNRVSPPMIDGRRLRRYKRRWKVERTFAWLHSYRRVVTRHEKSCQRFEGFVQMACAFMALGNLI
jgi:transposase